LCLLHLNSLAALACSVNGSGGELTNPDEREWNTLLVTAKTPADQHKLVAYYHEKAHQLAAKAQDFAEHADLLALSLRPSSPSKEPGANARANTATSQNPSLRKRKKRKTKRRSTIIWLSN
jgi:hypothetical protein